MHIYIFLHIYILTYARICIHIHTWNQKDEIGREREKYLNNVLSRSDAVIQRTPLQSWVATIVWLRNRAAFLHQSMEFLQITKGSCCVYIVPSSRRILISFLLLLLDVLLLRHGLDLWCRRRRHRQRFHFFKVKKRQAKQIAHSLRNGPCIFIISRNAPCIFSTSPFYFLLFSFLFFSFLFFSFIFFYFILFSFRWMGKYPIFVVNQLSHGPILALEDDKISFFLSFPKCPLYFPYLLKCPLYFLYLPKCPYSFAISQNAPIFSLFPEMSLVSSLFPKVALVFPKMPLCFHYFPKCPYLFLFPEMPPQLDSYFLHYDFLEELTLVALCFYIHSVPWVFGTIFMSSSCTHSPLVSFITRIGQLILTHAPTAHYITRRLDNWTSYLNTINTQNLTFYAKIDPFRTSYYKYS